MKYLVHYGYYECNGIRMLDTLDKVKKFRAKCFEANQKKYGQMFEVLEVKFVRRLEDHETL